ncbi:MAG TPA: aldose epimerase family protein [Acetobacteraceae bacterium]|nr:aldose epimerase family protein [Acetobacteraceae bacterium]
MTIEPYGTTPLGEAVRRVTIEDGIRIQVLTFGAILERIELPDGTNVALGLDNLEDYATRSPHFGAIAGRYAGRIGGARFMLDGVVYHLPRNEGGNTLHGGPHGFSKRVWSIERTSRDAVTLAYVSADGEEGFPGRLQTRLTYSIAGQTLRIEYEATTDRPTVLNLTNHSYFNLGGEGSGDVYDHVVRIWGAEVLETDAASIPTGRFLEVEGTPFDFRTPHAIGERIRVAHPQIVFGLGYDQCFVLDGRGMRQAAKVMHLQSGRALEVWTDQPGLQFYTGNKLTGALVGPSGRTYRSGDGFCLETQHYPDSPNHPNFPSTVLRPDHVFRSATEYRFSTGGTEG